MTVKVSKVITTQINAKCRECTWSRDDFDTEDMAYVHAEDTKHHVVIERGQSYSFNPKTNH